MKKILVASYHRASDGALSKLISKMKEENIYTDIYDEADIILVPGDRDETFEIALKAFKDNKPIIHLWAGDYTPTWETHNDAYRHAITLMSAIQLCTNDTAKNRVKELCMSVGKKYHVATVGNVMLDNMEIDESVANNTTQPYDLVLYNPPSRLSHFDILEEIRSIEHMCNKHTVWLPPNGDIGSGYLEEYITHNDLPREQFLGLLKNCDRFITNSSCQYYEAPFLIDKSKIIPIGIRNKERESKDADMSIPNASENIMKMLRSL